MKAKERSSEVCRAEGHGWAVGMCRLSVAVLLLSGILNATPIKAHGEWQLQGSQQVAGSSFSSTAMKSAVGLAAMNTGAGPSLGSGISSRTGDTCLAANGCSSPVAVPEPQSLVLVGTGLLSMAGVIRRRLSR